MHFHDQCVGSTLHADLFSESTESTYHSRQKPGWRRKDEGVPDVEYRVHRMVGTA